MSVKKIVLLGLCSLFISCVSAEKKIARAREKDPVYQYNMGLFYLNSSTNDPSTPDRAINHFDRALALNPQYYLALNGRGLALSLKGDFQGSILAFEKCLEINPNFTEARNNLGTVYMGIGLVTKAEEQFLRAAADEKYSSRELPYYNLARISFSQDKLDEALDYVQKSIELNRRLAMAHNLRGFILEKKGLLAEAIESYKQAAKIVPDEVNFSYNLAVAYFNNNELAKAQEIFEQILDKAQEPEMKENIQQYLKKIKKQP